jgi:hypothetical protein
MKSSAATVEQYLTELPDDRQIVLFTAVAVEVISGLVAILKQMAKLQQ